MGAFTDRLRSGRWTEQLEADRTVVNIIRFSLGPVMAYQALRHRRAFPRAS